MLQNLHVKNLALIKEADVYFREGLNILTGETGAGKSIIIDSINIALGGKVPKEMLKEDVPYTLVELIFSLNENVKNLLKKHEIDTYEEETLIISRKIVNGRSTVKINGESVSLNTLKDITGNLIDIHGQHDHQSLLYKSKHLEILDQFAFSNIDKLLEEVKREYAQYIELKKQLSGFTLDEEVRLRECSFLQFEIDEINDAHLHPGEDEELEAIYKKMSNAKKIVQGLSSVYSEINYDNTQGAGESISRAAKELNSILSLDEALENMNNQLMDLDSICRDLTREISEYIGNLSFDEEYINQVENRLDLINKLKSKYGNELEAIHNYRNQKMTELDKLNNYEESRNTIISAIEKSQKNLVKKCEMLSDKRKKSAKILQERIKAALEELNFLDVQFEIVFERLEHATSKGIDNLEFMISLNPGEYIKSLSKVASGGELSRIMLAIKTILAKEDQIDTLIFDEIDTGISGRTAQMVSQKLAVIGKDNQVICITHLPQIAAMADHHYLIEKSVKKDSTITEIIQLNEEEIIGELARLLGGVQITDTVIKNAREMKDLAKQTKLL